MGENKFLDDLAKFGSSTVTAFSGLQRQVRKWVSEQVEHMITSADLVKRSELDQKIAELEQKIEALSPKPAEKKIKKVS